ncbi:MAG: hypothetical protein MZV70_68310 [Desulfobacterales bacterium]|nr:hypothetical protein [Desulfobacterales bacterium]
MPPAMRPGRSNGCKARSHAAAPRPGRPHALRDRRQPLARHARAARLCRPEAPRAGGGDVRVGRQLAQVLPGGRGPRRRLPPAGADHGVGHGRRPGDRRSRRRDASSAMTPAGR